MKKKEEDNRNSKLTAGQKASDSLTKFAGSWKFIIILFVFLAAWITLNTIALIGKWDPWPFIILNLVLSSLAAIQAPIILMSQNRQGEKDRQRFEYDYATNRKAAKEVNDIRKQLNRIESTIRGKKKK